MSLPTVYVVAATGTQGSAVCRHLRQSNCSVRATVRNIESPQAQALAKIGVVLNSGNWDDEEALTAGLTGCNKLFLALGPNYSNLDDERIWAQRIIALAKKAGVEDVVYSSSISADAPEKRTLLPPSHFLFKSLFIKNVIEGLVQRAGFKHWAIIRPGFFMSNLLAPKARIYSDLFERNTWLTALKPDTKLNLVDPQDIAKFAFAVFNEPERFNGEGIDLVSERLTAVQMMEILADATGRDMKAEFYTDEQVAQAMDTNPFIGSQVFLRDGEKCVDAERVKTWGIGLGSFKEFLVREKDAVSETYAFRDLMINNAHVVPRTILLSFILWQYLSNTPAMATGTCHSMMGLTAVQYFRNFKRYSRPPASESEICWSSRIDQETSQLAEFVSGSSSVDLPLSSDEALTTQSEISTTADETTFEATTTPEPPTTTVDACVAGITSVGGSPPLQDRIDDCEEFNVITVSPYTVTETILSKRWEYRIPTGWPTARPTNKQLVRRQDPEATTIFPSETPAYATYCDSAEKYYDACSSAGVTAVTTTLTTPTETETEEEPACRGASMVKRAGEGLGYQFEDDWDVIRMLGWRYF
ncbi:hypothetical protein NOF04DRAFT_1362384, partial [Fusarium oxysporum II5]